MSPKLLAAVFEVVSAKEKLEAKGLEESKAVAKAADKLSETIDAVVSVLDPDPLKVDGANPKTEETN